MLHSAKKPEEVTVSSALQGRIAVVTGASKGLGQQMAESLAAAGASVALVARSEDLLNAVASGIREAGGPRRSDRRGRRR